MAGADGDAHGGLLVGRDAEQALIAARLADREAGTAILVRGPAGIGKTTLAGLHHCR
jgi:MoxR-like ATPase